MDRGHRELSALWPRIDGDSIHVSMTTFVSRYMSICIGLAIFRMRKIEIYRHHDTILYGLIFKTFGMYLFPIIFVNFKTWFGASIPVE